MQLSESPLFIKNYLAEESVPVDFEQAWNAMKNFTKNRVDSTTDEIWLLEHSPIYTLGQSASESHVLNKKSIPLLKIDRGGQVTYHGPGQIMLYFLADIKRKNVGVRDFVVALESSVIDVLAEYNISSAGDRNAPGVYVSKKKIASIGLRISRGYSYHGICFNFAFDASPFAGINPCGYAGMQVTQLRELVDVLPSKNDFVGLWVNHLVSRLKYIKIEDEKLIWGQP